MKINTPSVFLLFYKQILRMENKENKSYIERIEIKGLWGRFDVNWTLHSDVNILVGENGTGKSTILLILQAILDTGLLVQKNIGSKSINYSLKIGNESQKFQCRVSKKIFGKDDSGFGYIPVGHAPPKNFLKDVFINYINTFEKELLEKDIISKIAQKDIKSYLDFELYTLETEYWKYQIELFERIVNQGFSKEKANRNHSLFLQKINQLFKNTGKIIGQNSKDKTIIFKQNDIELSLYDLSSGEKQLLIILLTVLLQDEKPSILLLDEPEISMHLYWQYELIEIIRTLNPNCQVIIVTHSPSIFTDGWRDRVFWIEDISHVINETEKV